MIPSEHELETLICETQAETCGLDTTMPDDYAHLLDILDKAIKQQHDHTLAMLKDDS
ncbi:hypothetical protein [Halomonas hibernica]|uniref:hypothetical protein n=1 Tax=Halomonas hibernica TaxID=2591147 RepID=UPI0015570C5A|nr:hypothetical protein [Halomonas hibernica]